MRILKNAGIYRILTPKTELKKQLTRIERAGRTCYQSEVKPTTPETAEKFVSMLLARGHESVIEHTSLTVKFLNCSRGFTHELVRHRLASFSQESTRYVDYAKRGDTETSLDRFRLRCVVPPHRNEKEPVLLEDGRKLTPRQMFSQIEMFYRGLRKAGWQPQDARQVLPIGLKSEIVVTANWREWRHIFFMRTARPAHWEIRGVMGKLLAELQTILPPVFADFHQAGEDENGLPYWEKR